MGQQDLYKCIGLLTVLMPPGRLAGRVVEPDAL
jgi:hypothetical protein